MPLVLVAAGSDVVTGSPAFALQDRVAFPLDGSISVSVVQWSSVNATSTTRV